MQRQHLAQTIKIAETRAKARSPSRAVQNPRPIFSIVNSGLNWGPPLENDATAPRGNHSHKRTTMNCCPADCHDLLDKHARVIATLGCLCLHSHIHGIRSDSSILVRSSGRPGHRNLLRLPGNTSHRDDTGRPVGAWNVERPDRR